MSSTKTYTVDEAKLLLEKFCVYQDRSHKDVLDKLYKIHMVLEAREVILLHLLQNDYLNEERFAKSYVRGKFNQNNWGRIKIKNNLRSKQISEKNISTALQEIIYQDYIETLQKLTNKKSDITKAKNKFEKRRKIFSHLQSKGYETPLILDALNKIL